jgi:uncharacterized membrane protein HdeD (DUF308 family)
MCPILCSDRNAIKKTLPFIAGVFCIVSGSFAIITSFMARKAQAKV